MPSRADLLKTLERSVIEGAISLLGWDLVRGDLRARIVEAEAYRGADDPGCHAFRGQTPRNKIMFGAPGFAYVYFTYGNHWMLNITAEPEGHGSAVLIRAAKPLSGLEIMRERRPKAIDDHGLLSGPGKIAAAFDIDSKDYGTRLLNPRSELKLEPGTPPKDILFGTRIGLSPGFGDEYPWRFIVEEDREWASHPQKDLKLLEKEIPSPFCELQKGEGQ
jgi:DNA-3-methyladenine glycosylase